MAIAIELTIKDQTRWKEIPLKDRTRNLMTPYEILRDYSYDEIVECFPTFYEDYIAGRIESGN